MKFSLFAAALVALGLASAASAASLSITATNGAAKADLDLTGTTLTVVLTNTTTAAGMGGAANLLTGLQLLPTGVTAGSTLTSQSFAQKFTFATQTTGAITNGSFDPSWALTTTPNALYFDGFGTGGVPIIGGPATGGTTYGNANNSLTSGPHGTYAYQSATFLLTVPGGFSLNAITGANFLFNTDGSVVVGGNPPTTGGGPRPVPLPAAAWAGLAMLGGMGLVKLRKKA